MNIQTKIETLFPTLKYCKYDWGSDAPCHLELQHGYRNTAAMKKAQERAKNAYLAIIPTELIQAYQPIEFVRVRMPDPASIITREAFVLEPLSLFWVPPKKILWRNRMSSRNR
jgi:hypothetical protein